MPGAYNLTLRNARMTALVTEAGNNAQIKLYNGSRPASGGALGAQTLIAELVGGSPIGTVANGQLSFGPVAEDNAANATGTPTWMRVFKSDGTTWVTDWDLSGFPACTAGQPVDITSCVITEGNG